ncbi:MAG: hypothetical protein ACRD96_23530, partial [Bryobacteraceae bacterium]
EWTGAPWTRLELAGTPPRDTDGANHAIVADLLEAIEKDRPPRSGGAEALWALEMAMALYESQRAGERVKFPLRRREHPLTA